MLLICADARAHDPSVPSRISGSPDNGLTYDSEELRNFPWARHGITNCSCCCYAQSANTLRRFDELWWISERLLCRLSFGRMVGSAPRKRRDGKHETQERTAARSWW